MKRVHLYLHKAWLCLIIGWSVLITMDSSSAHMPWLFISTYTLLLVTYSINQRSRTHQESWLMKVGIMLVVCSMCMQWMCIASGEQFCCYSLLSISCWSLVFFSALQVVLSLSQAHFPLLVKPRAHFSYHFSLSHLATIWCLILTYPLSLILNPSLMFKPHKPSFSHAQPPFTLLTTIDLWIGDHRQLSARITIWH